jgi:hypothetical protein
MFKFSKCINTRKDHFAELKAAIDTAVETALKANVRPANIESVLEAWLPALQKRQHILDELRNGALPRQYDALTLKEIDVHGQIARDEEKRIAQKLRDDQAEYQEHLKRRYGDGL